MSLSGQLIGLIDTELNELSIAILGGKMNLEGYKYASGKHEGLQLAKLLLKEVLESAKRDDDNDI